MKKALINNKQLINSIKEWANYNDTYKVRCNLLTYDHGGVCLYNVILQLYDYRLRIVVQFFLDKNSVVKIKDNKEYTIAELCGEE